MPLTPDRCAAARRKRRQMLLVGLPLLGALAVWAVWVPIPDGAGAGTPPPQSLTRAVELERWRDIAPPPAAPPPPPVVMAPDPTIRLLSILQTGDTRRALVQVDQQPPQRVTVGQDLAGWAVQTIDATGIEVVLGERQLRVEMVR